MILDIFDIDEFIKQNHCPEVTSPILFNFDKTANATGLLSQELFGITETERKNIFGYIDLNGPYIHPIVFSLLNTRMGSTKNIINGSKHAIITANGKLEVVPEETEGAGTGINFLYENFEKIKWINETEDDEIDSVDKKTRLNFLKQIKKNEFFVTKWLVLPPFYREENSTQGTMGSDINKLYKELIAATRTMRTNFGLNLFGESSKMRIQLLIFQLYQMTITPISGKSLDIEKGTLSGKSKNSVLKKNLVGKKLDYGSVNVITAPIISDASSVIKTPAKFNECATPLKTLLSCFKPFFVEECERILIELAGELEAQYANIIKKINRQQFSTDAVDKKIVSFIKSPNNAYGNYDYVEYDYINNNNEEETGTFLVFEYRSKHDADYDENRIERPLTYLELFYRIADDILRDKHLCITRQPVTNYQNIYFSNIKILSTARTRTAWFRENLAAIEQVVEYTDYPYVDYEGNNEKKAPLYYELFSVCIINNKVLKSLGADYDGDTVYLRGLFTKEGNAEAEKLIYAKSNMLSASGSPSRSLTKIGKDCTVAMYELTKDID